MERAETAKLLMLISALYPNWKPTNIALTTEAWSIVMQDYPYHEIEQSLYNFSQENKSGFAPSPGQLIAPIKDRQAKVELSEWEKSLVRIPDTELRTIREERKGIDRSWERKEPENYDDLLRIPKGWEHGSSDD